MRLPRKSQGRAPTADFKGMWGLDDLEPAASLMESRLLYPEGRSRAFSPLLGSVVPALLPRLSSDELVLLGQLRGPVSPLVLPLSAPSRVLVQQVWVRRSLQDYYLDRLLDPDHELRRGVESACDIAAVLHLEPWVSAPVRDETMRPLRELIGPESELGFGPAFVEVLDVLGRIGDVTTTGAQIAALRDVWMANPMRYWDGVAGELFAAASLTRRVVSLRMVHRVTAVSSDAVRRGVVFRAARLRSAALILADVVDEDLVLAASEPWLAGVTTDPAAA